MLKFENNTPLRMCLTASGREVLVALAAGGICLVRLSQASAHPYPVLTLDQGSLTPCSSIAWILERCCSPVNPDFLNPAIWAE